MHPELFGFVKSYGMMLAISFALGMWLSVVRGRRHGLASETVLDLVFAVLVSSVLGVRILYVLTHLDYYHHQWYRVFFIWDGGMTLYGGIIAATATVWYLTRRQGIPFLVMADIFSPGVLLGIGITRIGCFLAGCCFGKPTGCSCAVHFPADSPAWKQFGDVAVHPSQLYASGGGFLAFALLLLLERKLRWRGAAFALFLILYGLSRFAVDFSRYYEPNAVMALGWSSNQWTSLVLIAGGAVLMAMGARGSLGGAWHAKGKR